MFQRQVELRRVGEAAATALSRFPEVRSIALFGSVARPLTREVPRFQPYRRLRIEVLHECKDVDLAVWIDRTDDLHALNRARNTAVSRFFEETGIGIGANHTDIFLFEPRTDRYLGRLCRFGTCPKGKAECPVPGCGRDPFLRQHADFTLDQNALAEHRIVRLYDRMS